MTAPVAALFVRSDGPYPARCADVWTEHEDALALHSRTPRTP